MNGAMIALGITGGIAAYKSAELCSRLVGRGFEVQPVMTASACRFIAPLTFQTLARRRVITDLWSTGDWKPAHIALAEEASLFIVAPATADFLAKFAGGIADDALTTFAVSFAGPVLLAPAMNPKMWRHPACVDNVLRLRSRGVRFCGPATGNVACGDSGEGRMSEPDEILTAALDLL